VTEKKQKPEEPVKPAAPAQPFVPPRVAGEWVLGPTGPVRKE